MVFIRLCVTLKHHVRFLKRIIPRGTTSSLQLWKRSELVLDVRLVLGFSEVSLNDT